MEIAARSLGSDVTVFGRNATIGNAATGEELYAYDQALSWPSILAAAAKLDVTSSHVDDQNSVSKGTVTLTVAAPAVFTLNSHALQTGDHVTITTTGALPTGLVAGQLYYAKVIDVNTFNLCATYADAMAGTNKITTTGTQSGTHTLFGPRTGCRKIVIFGLDGNYAPISEEVSLNGQTIVTTAKSFLRVFGASCSNVGTSLVNLGDIHMVKTGTGGTYTTGAPGTLTSAICKILVGYGTSGNGMYTVPAGKTARLKGLILSCRGQACTFMLVSQRLNDVLDNSLHTDFFAEVNVSLPMVISAEELGMNYSWGEKTDIRMRAVAAAASGIASVMMILEVE
jgi:hypothetical protein